ncbi:hypothetical protein [Rhizobium sp. A37_96]
MISRRAVLGGIAALFTSTALNLEAAYGRQTPQLKQDASSRRRLYSAYSPDIVRVPIDTNSGLYRHVPSITAGPDKHLLGAYLRNTSSAAESVKGQRAVFVRSYDEGSSWSAPYEELNDNRFCTNPLDPNGDDRIQGEVFVYYDSATNEEIAILVHRGGLPGSNPAFIAFRPGTQNDAPDAKWKVYGITFDRQTNQPIIRLCDHQNGGEEKLTYRVDDIEYDVIPFKPVIGSDGSLVVPVTLLQNFNEEHKVSFLKRSNGAWTMGGVIPMGVMSPPDAWEPTTWQAGNGVWYCQARRLKATGGVSYDNHAIAQSSDLISWSPFENLDEDIHDNRNIRMRARHNLWLGVGTSHFIKRNNLALFVSPDGRNWVHGTTIGAEREKSDFVHYGDIAVSGQTAYVLYSEGDDRQITTGPNAIRFARFPLPADLPLMGSDKHVFEAEKGKDPFITANFLTLPPGQIGSVPTPASHCVLHLKAKVSAPPNAVPYKIASVGDQFAGYFSIEYRNERGTTALYAGDKYVEDVPDPTEFKDLIIEIDVDHRMVHACGQSQTLGLYGRAYLGDVTLLKTFESGNITYDADGCWLETLAR